MFTLGATWDHKHEKNMSDGKNTGPAAQHSSECPLFTAFSHVSNRNGTVIGIHTYIGEWSVIHAGVWPSDSRGGD